MKAVFQKWPSQHFFEHKKWAHDIIYYVKGRKCPPNLSRQEFTVDLSKIKVLGKSVGKDAGFRQVLAEIFDCEIFGMTAGIGPRNAS